ncbi:MAG: AAA family ATPase [Clostridia bacterium]|nr:AAA family ATPase [Clostridia bacterium]
MSKAIMILGQSGSGKTTSLRNLNPSESFYIDADGKGLSWKGWRKQYCKENKNYYRTDDADQIYAIMQQIDTKQKQIKYLIIDTLNGIMVGDEMRRAKDKGYDKWMDLAQSVFNIVDYSNKMRDDLFVILMAHSQTSDDGFTCMLTNGRKLNKICLESKMTTVLIAKEIDGKYVFETRAHNSTAKTPMGAFDEDIIENDIVPVIKVLEEF